MLQRILLIATLAAVTCPAQLTPEQKIADFQNLADIFAKNYGPYEWKRDFKGFDLFQTGPWMERVRRSRNDLEFFEVMRDYAGAFDDAHVTYQAPSGFVARLNFTVDIFEGRVLVDFINRARLPATEFPFRTGYELISVDGQSAEALIAEYSRFAVAANPESTRRTAATLITTRPQWAILRAPELGEMATVVMRGLDGVRQTYRIPWAKSGLPLTKVGPVPMPTVAGREAADDAEPEYLRTWRRLMTCQVANRGVLGVGSRTPVFRLPFDFVQRAGTQPTDFFYSGTFQSGGYRIGFLRIPSFAPANLTAALQQFLGEIQFLQANTDGLILDIMRNPGGFVDYTNILLQLVFPSEFRTVGFEVRATSWWVLQLSSALEQAKAFGASPFVIGQLEFLKDQLVTANREMRGRTWAIPLDDITLDRLPIRSNNGAMLAYTKPLMVLVDGFTASAGDVLAATIQDNDRGVLFGKRTMGAGGNVSGYLAGSYSEGFVFVTESLMYRKRLVQPPGYPATHYIENAGVHPDIEGDIMTQDNLLLDGRIFAGEFIAAMVEHIRKSR